MVIRLQNMVEKEKLSCEGKFERLQSAVRDIIRKERIFGSRERLNKLKILDRDIIGIRSRIRNTRVSAEKVLLNMLIGLKCVGNVAQFSVPQQLDNADRVIEEVNDCLGFSNEILGLIDMNLPSTEEFIHHLCQKIEVKPRFLMACCDGIFDSMLFILGNEELLTNCLEPFFKMYLREKEVLKLKDFYVKMPEEVRSKMLKNGFLRKIAEKIAEEESNIVFDEEDEKMVKISFLLKILRRCLEERGKLNLEEISDKMKISLRIVIQIVLKLLKEELEQLIKIIQQNES